MAHEIYWEKEKKSFWKIIIFQTKIQKITVQVSGNITLNVE